MVLIGIEINAAILIGIDWHWTMIQRVLIYVQVHIDLRTINNKEILPIKMQITDKVALVVGGARGIGQAYCNALLEKGAKVE